MKIVIAGTGYVGLVAGACLAEVTLKDTDIAFIFTEWKEITQINLLKYKELMKTLVIYYGRNCCCLSEASEACI